MRDSIELEWAGVASVCIVHSALAGSARAMARISGHDDYPFIVVDYPFVPFAVWTPDEIAALATQLAPQVRAALTSQLPIDSTLDHRDLEQRVECSERDLKVTEERDVSP